MQCAEVTSERDLVGVENFPFSKKTFLRIRHKGFLENCLSSEIKTARTGKEGGNPFRIPPPAVGVGKAVWDRLGGETRHSPNLLQLAPTVLSPQHYVIENKTFKSREVSFKNIIALTTVNLPALTRALSPVLRMQRSFSMAAGPLEAGLVLTEVD
jgi:hypothetical protein